MADQDEAVPRTRSEQNRINRTTHGMSYHPLFKLVSWILRNEAVVPEWWDVRFFIEAIESPAEAGPRPSLSWILVTKDGSGVYRPGNIQWHFRIKAMSRRAAKAFEKRLKLGTALGDPSEIACLCWIKDPDGPCPDPECFCPWEARVECRCCVGIKTRLGAYHGDRATSYDSDGAAEGD